MANQQKKQGANLKARVKLRLGDLFDGPSDLIVLPCSTGGDITDFVDNHLRYFKIPFPKPGMELGDVEIMPFEGGENIAQYVAFAASVRLLSSKPTAIEKIGAKIGDFTKTQSSVRAIASPLLGAGAGGLKSEVVVRSLHKGFLAHAKPQATLTISVLHKNVFERLKRNLKDLLSHSSAIDHTIDKQEVGNKPPLRVFISHTSTGSSHKEWVKTLATFLRKNGVDARLDIWHLRHGMDLPQWMCNELQLADRVIIVSDESYAQRADGRHGGVGWETMIIQGNMANLPPESTKYIAIVRSKSFDEGVPFYLKTKYCMHWASSVKDEALQDLLLKELYNIDLAPPIGEAPLFI